MYLCLRCKKKHRISVWHDNKGSHYLCHWSDKFLKEDEVELI